MFVAGVTLASVLVSLLVTALIFGSETSLSVLTISAVVPLIVAPVASYIAARLIVQNVELRDRAEIARKAAEASNQELQETLQRQMLTFSIIGHEVRTPAATLQMMVETPHYLEGSENLLQARQTASHLIDVLDDMRYLANPDTKIEGHIETVNLADLVRQSVLSQSVFAEKQKLDLHVAPLDDINLDFRTHPQLLRQIFINIVRNCLLHSGANQLKISVKKVQIDPLQIELRFADNGRGVPTGKQSKMFELYERGTTQASGLGLGLHICRKFLIKNLNGEITYEDTPGAGATFVVTLQVEPVSQKRSDTSVNTPQLTDMRILLVEDSAVMRKVTKIQLEAQGAQVDEADNGRDGLSKAAFRKYDLILSDVFMPEMTGPEMAKLIKAQGNQATIVGLSANINSENANEFLASGAAFLLEKPLDVQTLTAHLGNLAQTGQSRKKSKL